MYCWGCPANSPRLHIFHDGRSLCMKWLYGGADQPVKDGVIVPQGDDCKECVRKLNKLREPRKPKK